MCKIDFRIDYEGYWQEWGCNSVGWVGVLYLPFFPQRIWSMLLLHTFAPCVCSTISLLNFALPVLYNLNWWRQIYIYIYRRNWMWRPEFRLGPRSVQFLLKKRNRYFFIPFLRSFLNAWSCPRYCKSQKLGFFPKIGSNPKNWDKSQISGQIPIFGPPDK